MTNEAMKAHDVRIIGDSNLGTGPFGLVRILGEAKSYEDMVCREMRVTGTVSAEKSVVCDDARIVGEVDIKGDCTMQTAKVTGNVKVGGNCIIQDASVIGEVKVAGDWQSTTTSVWGCLIVNGQCATEQIKVRGSLDVKGLLNFDQAEFASGYPSRIQELGGRRIEVRKPRMPRRLLNNSFRSVILEAQIIEVDDIDIDYTTADVVRGCRVKIGKHCCIGKVEYTESLVVEDGAEVGESSRRG
ncbi:MAG: hypothetical protein FWG40_07330 [Peptococcaceae bacterium]|nr:hypothetical protein [Peptococcaceae bacterium]